MMCMFCPSHKETKFLLVGYAHGEMIVFSCCEDCKDGWVKLYDIREIKELEKDDKQNKN